MFRGLEKPTDSIVVQSNYVDNPWFPEELEQERLDCIRQNPDQYAHIWTGEYVTVVSGAYYAKQLAAAKSEHRICRIGIDPLMSMWAFWDIGGTGAKADAAAIWICQFVGKEIRFLDHYEAQGQTLGTHLQWLRDRGYSRAECVLPHDGAHANTIFNTSYENEIRKAGFSVRVIENQGTGAAMGRVDAARRLFPQMWFESERCAAGLQALGWYHEKKDEARGIGLGPCHDWSSHSADAFGAVAVAHEAISQPRRVEEPRQFSSRSWMG
jgi:phage terminase large subunit